MSERTGWDRRLSVAADGRGLIGHAGVVLLHAERVGLTGALGRLWLTGQNATWRDRAHVLLSLAAAIVLGATTLSEAKELQAHHTGLLGNPPPTPPRAVPWPPRRVLAEASHPAPGHHLTAGHRPEDQEGEQPRACGTRRPRSVTRRPTPPTEGILQAKR